MKTTKWILTCALAVTMTAAAIWAQKAEPDNMSGQSAELDMLVDLAEMDLLADMLESLLQDEENADGSFIADSRIPESGLADIPGMDIDIYGSEFAMGNMRGFDGFPIMAGYGGMNGFSGCPMMGGFDYMGGFCGF